MILSYLLNYLLSSFCQRKKFSARLPCILDIQIHPFNLQDKTHYYNYFIIMERAFTDLINPYYLQLQAFLIHQWEHWRPRIFPLGRKLIAALGEDPISQGISDSTNSALVGQGECHCLTLTDLSTLQHGSRPDTPTNTAIFWRWQLYPLEEMKQLPQQSHQSRTKSKVLVCTRPLFGERNHSRLGMSSKNSVIITETDDDEDIDSISTVSAGVFGQSSTMDHQKMNAMELQLASLHEKMAQLLQQQQAGTSGSGSKPIADEKETNGKSQSKTLPAPPPPAPPLPPSLKADLLRAPSQKKFKPEEEKTDEKVNGLKKPPTPPPKQTPTMVDILKDIGNVKLKKTNRPSPRGTPTARAKKQLLDLENDKSLAGALARALCERRKKMKLDSEDGEFDGDGPNNKQHDESADGWSDSENESVADKTKSANDVEEIERDENDEVFNVVIKPNSI